MKIVIDGNLIDPGMVTHVTLSKLSPIMVIHLVGKGYIEINRQRQIHDLENYQKSMEEVIKIHDEFMKHWEPEAKFIHIK